MRTRALAALSYRRKRKKRPKTFSPTDAAANADDAANADAAATRTNGRETVKTIHLTFRHKSCVFTVYSRALELAKAQARIAPRL